MVLRNHGSRISIVLIKSQLGLGLMLGLGRPHAPGSLEGGLLSAPVPLPYVFQGPVLTAALPSGVYVFFFFLVLSPGYSIVSIDKNVCCPSPYRFIP